MSLMSGVGDNKLTLLLGWSLFSLVKLLRLHSNSMNKIRVEKRKEKLDTDVGWSLASSLGQNLDNDLGVVNKMGGHSSRVLKFFATNTNINYNISKEKIDVAKVLYSDYFHWPNLGN